MTSSKPSFIVYSLQGFHDPLFQGLILQYLKKINTPKVRYYFHVITYEQEQYATTPAEREEIRQEFEQYGILWYPVRYHHVNRFVLFYRLWDFLQTFRQAVRIKLRYRVKAIFGYLIIASSFSFIISRLLGLRFALHCFEPHSDYLADFGEWKRSSLSYRLLNTFERLAATTAEYLTVPTKHTLDLIKPWKPKAKEIFQVPICVDTDKFQFSAESRAEIRAAFGMEDRKVVLYLGKFGGLYYSVAEVARFSGLMYQKDPTLFFFTITTHEVAETEAAYRAAGIPESDFLVHPKVPYQEVERYISAADMGLVAIPPYPSQKYRTPVKVGNYLACGLPYIITRGISDDDELAEKEGVGAVFESFNQKDFEQGWEQVAKLFLENKQTLREKCRKIGVEYRGLHRTEKVLHQIFEALS